MSEEARQEPVHCISEVREVDPRAPNCPVCGALMVRSLPHKTPLSTYVWRCLSCGEEQKEGRSVEEARQEEAIRELEQNQEQTLADWKTDREALKARIEELEGTIRPTQRTLAEAMHSLNMWLSGTYRPSDDCTYAICQMCLRSWPINRNPDGTAGMNVDHSQEKRCGATHRIIVEIDQILDALRSVLK